MKKSAFTLIELLVTVSIVALLSGLVIINIFGNLAKARDAKRKNDLREIKTALEIYYNLTNMYPSSMNSSWPPQFNGNETISGCGSLSNPTPDQCPWGSPWTQDNVTYMGQVPRDPTASQSYYYRRASGGRLSYLLIAKLERSFDPDIVSSQSNCEDASQGYTFSGNPWYVVCEAR